jgi:hypothetical protein
MRINSGERILFPAVASHSGSIQNCAVLKTNDLGPQKFQGRISKEKDNSN